MIAVAREHGHQGLLASACSDYGWWAAILGDGQTGLTQSRRGLEIAEKLGSQMARVYAYNALGFAELSAGRWSEAVSPLEQGLRIAQEMRTGQEAGVLTLAHLAEAHLGQGNPARAQELAEKAVSEACRHRVLSSECFARLVHARVLLSAEGQAEGSVAATALERALALVEETGARCYEPFIRIERAELARLTGDEAARELREAHRLFTEMGATAHAARLAKELGL